MNPTGSGFSILDKLHDFIMVNIKPGYESGSGQNMSFLPDPDLEKDRIRPGIRIPDPVKKIPESELLYDVKLWEGDKTLLIFLKIITNFASSHLDLIHLFFSETQDKAQENRNRFSSCMQVIAGAGTARRRNRFSSCMQVIAGAGTARNRKRFSSCMQVIAGAGMHS